jgi:TPR repeat protein
MRALNIPALSLCLVLTACAAAQNGQQLAQTFDSGVAAYDAGDKARAFRIWQEISDQDLAAMRNVAMMLRKGDGVKQDLPGAEAMYRRAAEAGLPTAQADLADMLLRGEVGGRPNPKAALPLLQAAAAANHPIAQFQLAQMYETGQEGLVPQDLERARNLYASAAERGMKQAEERLKTIGPPTRRTNNGQQAPSAPSP